MDSLAPSITASPTSSGGTSRRKATDGPRWGPQYTAHQFQGELRWLGIRSSPSYVGEPECNGIAERFMRTLKEECLYLHDFESLEQARQIIHEFIERYNREWLVQRHGYMTPAQTRIELTRKAA
jgi:transposase InsO family protein